MPSYDKSDYALNRKSKSILYKLASGEVIKVTKAQYLRISPDNTEEKWKELKEVSDQMYKEEMEQDTKQTKTKKKQAKEKISDKSSEPPSSIDETLINNEEKAKIRALGHKLLESGKLTDVQKTRFLLYYIQGLSYRKIAEIENVHFTSIQESIQACRKKLKKFYKKS